MATPGDRRKPVARYVVFTDEESQAALTQAAEEIYRRLGQLDEWAGPTELALPTGTTVVRKRGLLRRPLVEEETERLAVSSGLAAAGRTALEVPPAVDELPGCPAGRMLAHSMGRVILELVRDLAASGHPTDQPGHPAYRQTMRLAAELQALHDVLAERGCQDPFGCVRARPPEHWGRRAEDVEVAEVRTVLAQLAAEETSSPETP